MAVYQPISSSSGVLNGGGDQLYFAGRPVSYGSDRLGSKRADSPNMQGQTIAYTYFPYGEEYTTTTQDTDKFGTYFRDSTTALDYARNRYYSNRLARFLTADPYRASGGPTNPGSWNRYAYVGGDPVNWYDPAGLDWWDPSTNTLHGDPDLVIPGSFVFNELYLANFMGAANVGGGGGGGGGGPRPNGNEEAINEAERDARTDVAKEKCYKLLGFSSAQDAQKWFANRITFHEQ